VKAGRNEIRSVDGGGRSIPCLLCYVIVLKTITNVSIKYATSIFRTVVMVKQQFYNSLFVQAKRGAEEIQQYVHPKGGGDL
jgi:hypothetical protein